MAKIYIIAGEDSGDFIGRALIKNLKAIFNRTSLIKNESILIQKFTAIYTNIDNTSLNVIDTIVFI